MYAVVRTGGKQYRVTAGDIFEVEKLEGEIGEVLTMDDVLLVSDGESATIGQPIVEGATVRAKITGQYRGKKILVFRYRPKKRIRVRRGHRQYLTRLEIESVSFGGVTYDTVPEKAVDEVAKPKRKKKKAAKPAAAVAPIVEDAVVEEPVAEVEVIEDAIVEDTIVEEVMAEEIVAEVEAVEEATVNDPVAEEPVTEVEEIEPVVVEEVAVEEEVADVVELDNLTKITGIGEVFQGRLREEFGITSFGQLATADAEKLAELCERSVEEVEGWISQAKEMES